MATVALSSQARSAALDAMSSGGELDVLIIGGGVTGAGSALDAVTRGLRVGIVEARDWSSGTSSRSSKLLHGGLRYLEMLDFGLVKEALHERGLLLSKLAPHLARPISFLYPLTHRVWERPYVGSGVLLYDMMAASSSTARGLPRHRHLPKRHALREAPALNPDSFTGAIKYWDGQVDDARFVMTLIRTAAGYGALCASRTELVGFLKEADRIIGANLVDSETGHEYTVHAKQVINATGVWTDEVQALAGEHGQFEVRASKGVHIVVPRNRIRSDTGLILRTEKSVLFVIPWGRHWIVGTTDTDWTLGKVHPAATASDINYLLDHVNKVLAVPLTRDDIEGVYAGLRPLVAGRADSTAKLSREHLVAHVAPGLVVIAGGKYTTYRVMAADAVDEAVREIGVQVPESVTSDVLLVGADGYAALWNQRSSLAARTKLPVARLEHMLHRYGSLVGELLDLIKQDPSLGEPLAGAEDYLRAEVVYAASHEDARHLEDVLTRRTRISVEIWDRGLAAARPAAELLAGVLGWDDEDVEREVARYHQRVDAEKAASALPDDEAAEEARLAAPDIVTSA